MDRPKLSTLQRRVRALGGGPISIFSCCINPRKAAASGLYERVRRTLGIGVEGLTDEEKRRREARRSKLLSESQQFSAEVLPHIISGLGPHPEAPVSSQRVITREEKSIHAVVKKIVRGCEYWLAGGRIVDRPYEIGILFPSEIPELVNKIMAAFAFGPVHLGPGLRIRRGGAQDDPLSAFYVRTKEAGSLGKSCYRQS